MLGCYKIHNKPYKTMSISPDIIQQHRERFYRQLPNFGFSFNNRYEVKPQVFLSELDPNGHLINDRMYYQDIVKEQPVLAKDGKPTGKTVPVTIPIERVSVPLQKVILEKHLTHLCGERIKFTNHNLNPTPKEQDLFSRFKQGWEKKNMETAKYEFCRSVKATGEGAFCASMDNGKFTYRVFSLLNGDTLHPIRDEKGRLRLFGRSFNTYDYTTQEHIMKMEVWDDTHVTVFSYRTLDKNDNVNTIQWDGETFKRLQAQSEEFDGWQIDKEPTTHSFKGIPIIYLKDEDGACWSHVQPLIDKLELALSQLFENNKHYAFRIMVVKGDVTIQGDLNGHARAMMFDDKDGDAKYMEGSDVSNSFGLQLTETLKHIERGGFVVFDTDKISGDLSGIALKIRYSPAIEQALNDKHLFNASIDIMVELFKEGYGIELGQISDFSSLDIRGDIQVYIHQSDTETYNNMVLGLNSGSISVQTATEVLPHAAADELSRLDRQKEKEREWEREELLGNLPKQNNPKQMDDGMNDKNLERQILADTNR